MAKITYLDKDKNQSDGRQLYTDADANEVKTVVNGLDDLIAAQGEDITQLGADLDIVEASNNLKAPLASPALTGTPTAPSPAPSSDNQAIVTTAYLKDELEAAFLANDPLDTLTILPFYAGNNNLSATAHPNSPQDVVANSPRYRLLADLSRMEQIKLQMWLQSQSSSPNNPRVYISYNLDLTGAGGTWVPIGDTLPASNQAISLAVPSGLNKETSWIDIPLAAKGPVLLRVTEDGGNASATPVYGRIIGITRAKNQLYNYDPLHTDIADTVKMDIPRVYGENGIKVNTNFTVNPTNGVSSYVAEVLVNSLVEPIITITGGYPLIKSGTWVAAVDNFYYFKVMKNTTGVIQSVRLNIVPII